MCRNEFRRGRHGQQHRRVRGGTQKSVGPYHRIGDHCRYAGACCFGPGLLESAYQACLAFELRKRGLEVATEVALPVVYEGVKLEVGYRIDLLVKTQVVVEIKTVESLLPIHTAQLLSYLKLSEQ